MGAVRTGDERVHGVRGLPLLERVLDEREDVGAAVGAAGGGGQRQRRLVELGQRRGVRAAPHQLGRRAPVPALHRPVQRRHAQHVPAQPAHSLCAL